MRAASRPAARSIVLSAVGAPAHGRRRHCGDDRPFSSPLNATPGPKTRQAKPDFPFFRTRADPGPSTATVAVVYSRILGRTDGLPSSRVIPLPNSRLGSSGRKLGEMGRAGKANPGFADASDEFASSITFDDGSPVPTPGDREFRGKMAPRPSVGGPGSSRVQANPNTGQLNMTTSGGWVGGARSPGSPAG